MVQALARCADQGLADRLADDGEVESHETSVAPLQRDHSWKYSFWRALEAD